MECLANCKFNKLYKIVKVDVKDTEVSNMLKNLMVIAGEEVKVTNSTYGKKALLIDVSGISYGIDITVAKNIYVEEKIDV